MTPRAYYTGYKHHPETYRYPRTLEQAFGQDTSRKLEPMKNKLHPHDLIVLWGCAAAVTIVGVLVWFGLIK